MASYDVAGKVCQAVPSAKAKKLVTLVMVILTPARSIANLQRDCTVPPPGSVQRASRNAAGQGP